MNVAVIIAGFTAVTALTVTPVPETATVVPAVVKLLPVTATSKLFLEGVEAGTPGFFAAPLSPATFPRDAVRAVSVARRSSEPTCSVELLFAAVSIAATKCNAPPRERITARSTTFSSSLTFPGQECDCSKSKVWAINPI